MCVSGNGKAERRIVPNRVGSAESVVYGPVDFSETIDKHGVHGYISKQVVRISL